jgi:type IV pilus assembly protein PilA
VALPAYQNYTLKAKFAEVVSIAAAYRTAVGICAQQLGTVTGCDLSTNDIPASQTTTHVGSVAVTNGVITVTPTKTTNTLSTLVLTPTLGVSALTWVTSGDCLSTQASGTTGVAVPILCKV